MKNWGDTNRPVLSTPLLAQRENWGSTNRPVLTNPAYPIIQESQPFATFKRFLDKDLLEARYVVQKRSCEEIATEIGAARTTVLKYLKVYGIPVRETGTSILKRRNLAYGRRIVNHEEIAHKRELENVEKMRRLREQGFSYWKIADVLNSMKIPTKTGRGRWHSRSVQAIMDRTIPTVQE